ncbi:4581_t:CDS:2 [Ambispora leptoticha]|uniref:4581_t:CDS:1 n=1 Tax=Ambispora leptoticha TaxID=144679 RepID=A0A9N8W321_9GLOM|nr:4581_t:CDS:2 [Ambispora leptoticha]
MTLKKKSSVKKNLGGRPPSEVWKWFLKGDESSKKGYYAATCSFCDQHWNIAKPSKLKTHLAYECQKVESDTRIKVLVSLTNDCVDSDNDMASTSTAASKKRKLENSVNIDSEYENIPTSLDKEDQINKILLKMVVCCNLPFAIVEHPFFQEYTKALRATYSIPSCWVLSNTLLDQELARVNIKVRRLLDKETNLTIAFDRWTNPTGRVLGRTEYDQSIYDYCVITEERKEFLWASKNYSGVPHHTGAFLGEEIIKVVEDIGPEKIAAIVSDNAANTRVAQRILCEKYPYILDIICVAHCINLITEDLCKHEFVRSAVRKIGIIHKYFTKSHAACQFLKDAIKILKIKGGDLKDHTKTRWSTMWDCVNSIVRLEFAFIRAPFDQPYNLRSDTPIIWWDTAQHKKEEWELQALALRLFAITPHSASCERSFSVLGWFYNQRRTNLAAERAEGMCKLHTFYITNAKQELPCYVVDMPENLLRNQLIESVTAINNESDETTDFLDTNNDNLSTEIDIDTTEVHTLSIMTDINIGLQIFNLDQKVNNEITVSPRRQTIILNSQHSDFDVETLARNMSMEIDNDVNS